MAVAFAIDSSIFDVHLRRIDVEINSPLCLGRTVVDVHGMSKKTPNVHLIERVDVDEFWKLMIDSLVRAKQRRHE